VLINWIEQSWITEFTVGIFGVDSKLGSLTDNDELIDSLSVLEVLVKVVLEMLDGIHMLLDEVVSSNLLEWESVVIKFPGVDSSWSSLWVLSLFLHLSIDVHGVFVMVLIEGS